MYRNVLKWMLRFGDKAVRKIRMNVTVPGRQIQGERGDRLQNTDYLPLCFVTGVLRLAVSGTCGHQGCPYGYGRLLSFFRMRMNHDG